MQHLKLDCQKRLLSGNQVRKVRNSGYIPAVVYGKGTSPLNIQLQKNNFVKLFRNAGRTSVIDIELEGEKSVPVLVHDVDYHPVSDVIRHVDFLVVDLKKKTHAEVPVVFVGEPDKSAGGLLNKVLDTIEVEALPEKIPHEIQVDLSILKNVGDSIHISDLKPLEGVEIITDSEALIATLNDYEEAEPEEISATDAIPATTEGEVVTKNENEA